MAQDGSESKARRLSAGVGKRRRDEPPAAPTPPEPAAADAVGPAVGAAGPAAGASSSRPKRLKEALSHVPPGRAVGRRSGARIDLTVADGARAPARQASRARPLDARARARASTPPRAPRGA
jgi:hypothetical protein